MKQYAWKIQGTEDMELEGISSLGELEAIPGQSALSSMHSPREIMAMTQAMQFECRGVYRHRAPGEAWTLLWIELR
jgi:hypothetical protein